jgi:hypothetical protein
MPYIDCRRRAPILEEGALPLNAGELNFAITSYLIDSTPIIDPSERVATIQHGVRLICDRYLIEGLTYQRINDVMGALHCAGLEYRRRTGDTLAQTALLNMARLTYDRIAVPYELQKIDANGDLPFVPVPRARA